MCSQTLICFPSPSISTHSAVHFSSSLTLGAGGVRVGSPVHFIAPVEALAHNVTVTDCVILDGGHVFHEGTGVLVQAATGCTVTHNRIGDLDYTGVSLGWSWGFKPTCEMFSGCWFTCKESRRWNQDGGIAKAGEKRVARQHCALVEVSYNKSKNADCALGSHV